MINITLSNKPQSLEITQLREASKTKEKKWNNDWNAWIKGQVLDIGAGNDPIIIGCDIFDLAQGNAQYLSNYYEANSYDSLFSSHCLEHMDDAKSAITEWWKLLKPGGYMVVIVPDHILYEQGFWPSIFNTDHKWAFSIDDSPDRHSRLLTIEELICDLENAKLVTCVYHDDDLDYKYLTKGCVNMKYQDSFWVRTLRLPFYRMRAGGIFILKHIDRLLYKYTKRPIDQTLYGSLAQILFVLKKS